MVRPDDRGLRVSPSVVEYPGPAVFGVFGLSCASHNLAKSSVSSTVRPLMEKPIFAMKLIALGLVPVLGLALLRSTFSVPVLVYNPSSSEPIGFYRLTKEAITPGRLAAFRVPELGRAYAAAHIPYVIRNSILKQIAAGPGNTVCVQKTRILVDGQPRGDIALHDRDGVALPHWAGCRRLGVGEYFALSNRIPNSFDSRYFGPLRSSDVLGVYSPLWTEGS